MYILKQRGCLLSLATDPTCRWSTQSPGRSKSQGPGWTSLWNGNGAWISDRKHKQAPSHRTAPYSCLGLAVATGRQDGQSLSLQKRTHAHSGHWLRDQPMNSIEDDAVAHKLMQLHCSGTPFLRRVLTSCFNVSLSLFLWFYTGTCGMFCAKHSKLKTTLWFLLYCWCFTEMEI